MRRHILSFVSNSRTRLRPSVCPKITSKRRYSAESKPPKDVVSTGKVHKTATPPPPPPPENGGGSGLWLLLTGAGIGAGFYFKDDLKTWWEKTSKDATLPVDPPGIKDILKTNLEEVKEEIKTAEEVLESKVKKATETVTEPSIEWSEVRKDIVQLLDSDSHDYGSFGPILVRLAWHSAGTYDKKTKRGGTEGACMRYEQEGNWGANKGLDIARSLLEPVKKKYPSMTYSDLWSFAGTVAIEEMGGPTMKWRPGRKDYLEAENVLPDGLLPDADGREDKVNVSKHIRFIFNRMGFNDQEIVALMGAHALGSCHTENSGYLGPWTFAPTTFSNEYFRLLVEEKWVPKDNEKGKPWTGPEQFTDSTGELMMLPTDMAMIHDKKFKKWTEIYAKDEERFFKDFAKAWMKLQENGVKEFNGWRKYIFFGPRV